MLLNAKSSSYFSTYIKFCRLFKQELQFNTVQSLKWMKTCLLFSDAQIMMKKCLELLWARNIKNNYALNPSNCPAACQVCVIKKQIRVISEIIKLPITNHIIRWMLLKLWSIIQNKDIQTIHKQESEKQT